MTSTILKEERGKSKTSEKESIIISGAVHNKKEDTTITESVLPLDVFGEITKHLNVFDYLNFRAIGKGFRLGAPPIQWSSMSRLRFDDHSLCPLLVSLNKDNNVFGFVHPKQGLKYNYTIKFPNHNFLGSNLANINSNSKISYSKDGWLLLTLNKDCSFFINPFTKKATHFDYGDKISGNKCVGFSKCPTSFKCVSVDNEYTPIFTLINDDTWFDSSYYYFTHYSHYNKNPTFHNGSFYFLSKEGCLGVIKLREEEDGASWREFRYLQSPCTKSIDHFLVECNGDLFSIFEGPFCKWVRVFKLNLSELNESTRTWTKVESLGDYMLFVGNSSFSAVANIRGMENKIYFPRFYDHSIVFYSLETKKYQTFENEVVDLKNVTEPLNSSWIEPRWK